MDYSTIDKLADNLDSESYIELESNHDYETNYEISSRFVHVLSIQICCEGNTEDSVSE